ncbi:MAG: hypothetical protein PGN29_07425 [Gordonia paraffinivorans]
MNPAATMLPASAIPIAAPSSREVSFTADATPWLSAGVDTMIPVVAGAVARPMPNASTDSWQAMTQ